MGRRVNIPILLLTIVILYSSEIVFAQKSKKKFSATPVKTGQADSSEANKSEFQINFYNINGTPFYYNPDKLKLIQQYEKKKDYKKLLPELEEYIRHYGIENFHKGNDLIWKLAQLYELMGDIEKSKSVYKLVLKHHRGKDLKQIRQHFDTLTTSEQQKYVPLEYYYELVEYR